MNRDSIRSPNLYLSLCAALFVAVLFVSACFDRSIRILHLFEAIPYVLAPWLCGRKPRVGYALAFASGAVWLWTAGFLTSFIRNGFERVVMLIEMGKVDRPDILLAVPGFIGTMGMVLGSLIGYWQLDRKRWNDVLLAGGMILAVFLFFVLIFAACAPQYLGMFRGIIGQ